MRDPYVPIWAGRLAFVTQAAILGWRLWALGAAAIGLAMVAVYGAIIFGLEDDNSLSEALPWILAMAIPALGAVISVVVNDRRSARVVLIGSAWCSSCLAW